MLKQQTTNMNGLSGLVSCVWRGGKNILLKKVILKWFLGISADLLHWKHWVFYIIILCFVCICLSPINLSFCIPRHISYIYECERHSVPCHDRIVDQLMLSWRVTRTHTIDTIDGIRVSEFAQFTCKHMSNYRSMYTGMRACCQRDDRWHVQNNTRYCTCLQKSLDSSWSSLFAMCAHICRSASITDRR